MKRQDLDHLLRAAGDLTGHRRFVLVGSNAIFAWYDHVPERMMVSRELDLFAFDVSETVAEEISDLLENIGHLSVFDDTHGYYADGVGPQTAILPEDWRERSRLYAPLSAPNVEALAPHPEDIAASKLCAGRDKDLDWVGAAHAAGFVDLDRVAARLDRLPGLTELERSTVLDRIKAVQRREQARVRTVRGPSSGHP